jgi:predicted DNA-binding transcriptional regulator YafY
LYRWANSPFGLALDGTQLNTLAMLLNTFAASTIPHAEELQGLLAALVERLPIEQQKKLAAYRQPFQIDLRETSDYRQGDAHNLRAIELAIERNQQLEFRYCSPRAGQERRHVIEPRPLVFKDGHVYLSGWNLEYEKELRYRLDYIIAGSAKPVPIKSAPSRPRQRTYQLRYHLTATIARHQVSEHFPQQRVERHDDGSATITADVTDLFEARRILLGYGENCTVLGPPELIEQFRIVAIDYGCKYLTEPM